MRKLALVCGILASVVSVSMGAMSEEEWNRAKHNCLENKDKSACQALTNEGRLIRVEHCDENCAFVGLVYYYAERYREAITYFEKAVALGDNLGYGMLGETYYGLQDYYNAKKYYEIACNKGNVGIEDIACHLLGQMYYDGKGVRQDYYKAHELYKKACDMKYGYACQELAWLYKKGKGVRQNSSTAEQYFEKACDLGDKRGCAMLEIEAVMRTPGGQKALIEAQKQELELKKLELQNKELEQKLQKYR